jgi:hypothetical protein
VPSSILSTPSTHTTPFQVFKKLGKLRNLIVLSLFDSKCSQSLKARKRKKVWKKKNDKNEDLHRTKEITQNSS